MSKQVTIYENDINNSKLPPKNTEFFTIRFIYANGHQRWAQVRFVEFEDDFLKSSISSIACCHEAVVEIFDAAIDRAHSRCYGEGKWLKTQRQSLSHDSPIGTCSGAERSALKALSIACGNKRPRDADITCEKERARDATGSKRPRVSASIYNKRVNEEPQLINVTETDHTNSEVFVKRLQELKDEVRNLPKYIRPVTDTSEKSASHKSALRNSNKYCENRTAFEKKSGDISKCLDGLIESAPYLQKDVDDVKALLSGAVETACFVDVVRSNVAKLKVVAPDDSWDSVPFGQFIYSLKAQRHAKQTELENVLEASTRLKDILSSAHKQVAKHFDVLKSEYNLYSSSTELLRRFLLDVRDRMLKASNGNVISEPLTPYLQNLLSSGLSFSQPTGRKSKRARKNDKRTADRKHRVSVFINRVINKLFKLVGANALAVYAAMKGAQFTSLGTTNLGDMEFFADSAVEALRESDIKLLPGSFRVLHIPGVLSWLLDVESVLIALPT
ncbi:hypothetical protein CaCOL14_000345 [Colletotrichum acutatum]